PVHLRTHQRLTVDRDQPLAVFPHALRQQLLCPRPEAGQSAGQERYLVASVGRQLDERRTEAHARLRIKLLSAFQQESNVNADDRRRDEPDVRERGVPPAHVRRVEETAPEPLARRQLLERRARVRDREKVLERPAVQWAHPRGEVAEKRDRLKRRTRLTRDDEQRLRKVERALYREN